MKFLQVHHVAILTTKSEYGPTDTTLMSANCCIVALTMNVLSADVTVLDNGC